MIGGGTWNKQNKKLPGAYGVFISKKKNTVPSQKKKTDSSSILGIAVLGKMVLSR